MAPLREIPPPTAAAPVGDDAGCGATAATSPGPAPERPRRAGERPTAPAGVGEGSTSAPPSAAGANAPMGPDLWARLERAARRPIAPGVLHPDACENVALHGVAWAIPPARATVRCVLRGGKVRWDPPRPSVPAGAEALLAVLPLRPARPCPRCGQPLADRLDPRDLSAADAALSAAAALAAELLRRQYVLTDEQLSGLLSFAAGEVPAWLATMAHWAARATGRPVRLTADRPGESRARPRLWRRMLHRGL